MPNQSLSPSMRKLLTGYVINFNHRYRRYGHLFQNRYKSIICEEDPYLLELTRYIHLNPVRAGVVKKLRGLRDYPWTGHAVILGAQQREWQDVGEILAYFGKRRKKAMGRYEEYVGERIKDGRRPELVGGGFIRSLGGWSVFLSMRGKGEKVASDERILGSGEFIGRVFSEAGERVRETLSWRGRVPDLQALLRGISEREGVEEGKVLGGDQRRLVVKVRKMFCREAVKKYGYSGARVARFLGVTASLVNRYYGVIRPCAPLRYSHPCGSST